MAIPFSLQAILNFPGGPGLPNDPISASVSSSFESQAEFRLSLTGSGSHTMDLGTLGAPGVKGLLVMVESSTTAAPVTVLLNGSVTGGTEISPGGFLLVGNPSPVAGITGVELVHTTAVTVRVWALG